MKFTVEYTETKEEPIDKYYRFNFEPPLKGDCGLLIVLADSLERGYGRDGAYHYRIGSDAMVVQVLRYNSSPFGDEADGVFYENWIKVHGKTLLDKLQKMTVGQKITITTWDEEYDQKAIKHDLSEVRNYLNQEIQKRQAYGVRSFTTTSPGYALLWSNASAKWMREGRFILEGERLSLDANEIFAPYTEAEIEAVVDDLSALPLYAYSLEGKSGIFGRPKEELRDNLEKLKSELEIANMEEDKLKQRNIIFTIDYIGKLLGEEEQILT